jgi:hypothetical protein
LVIANTDTNTGLCVFELKQYISDAMVHLNDEVIYEMLKEEETQAEGQCLFQDSWRWTDMAKAKGTIHNDKVKYVRKHTTENSENPPGYFYLLYTVHRAHSPGKPVQTRPVCLDCASITDPIGRWIDIKLQPTANKLYIFLKDSFEFKKRIDNVGKLNPIVRLFIYAAKSMYTNIPTEYSLEVISYYLRDNHFNYDHYHDLILTTTLDIVKRNNIMKFGNQFGKQSTGTVKENLPVHVCAKVFKELHKLDFIPGWKEFLILPTRFIDCGFGIWSPPAELFDKEAYAK